MVSVELDLIVRGLGFMYVAMLVVGKGTMLVGECQRECGKRFHSLQD